MILKVTKDFMVFKQRDFSAKWFTVVDFIRSKQFFIDLYRGKRGRCHCFVNLGFPRTINFAWK